jgi:hypothetical protein
MSAAGRRLLLLALVALAAGCAPVLPPAKTALEVRAFQTYTFDTADSKLIMKAMVNALQDDGYVLRNAVIELGLITATKETDLAPGRYTDSVGAGVFGWQPGPAFAKLEVNDFTGNVSELGEQTRIRISFQRKVLDSRGQVIEVQPIDDAAFYRDFFSRIDKSVYLQKERL